MSKHFLSTLSTARGYIVPCSCFVNATDGALTQPQHAGNEGAREFPLWKAYNVKEMFDSLAEGGFRPLILGWSGMSNLTLPPRHLVAHVDTVENPFPMIGGSEPPPEPKREKPKTAATWSNTVSGHSDRDGSTPHDRVMAIIERDEQQEAERRKDDVEKASTEKSGLMGAYAAV